MLLQLAADRAEPHPDFLSMLELTHLFDIWSVLLFLDGIVSKNACANESSAPYYDMLVLEGLDALFTPLSQPLSGQSSASRPASSASPSTDPLLAALLLRLRALAAAGSAVVLFGPAPPSHAAALFAESVDTSLRLRPLPGDPLTRGRPFHLGTAHPPPYFSFVSLFHLSCCA